MSREKLPSEVGKRIKVFRKSQKLTLAQFAAQAGITPGFLSDLENGKKGIKKTTVIAIALAFSLSEQWLFLGEGAMYKTETHHPQSKQSEIIPGGKKEVTNSKIQLLLDQARYVLASGPEKYSHALAMCIEGFLGAVQAEEDRRECRTQLGELVDKEAADSLAPKMVSDPQ
jgi:transcriptional regulator with XRE-family HTH domain